MHVQHSIEAKRCRTPEMNCASNRFSSMSELRCRYPSSRGEPCAQARVHRDKTPWTSVAVNALDFCQAGLRKRQTCTPRQVLMQRTQPKLESAHTPRRSCAKYWSRRDVLHDTRKCSVHPPALERHEVYPTTGVCAA